MSSNVAKPPLNTLTIMSAAAVAWVLFAVLHEIVGHAGAALLLGERVRGAVSTTVHIVDFYDAERVAERIGWWGFRAVASAGTLVNFITAAVALGLLASKRVRSAAARYFLWFFSTISIFQQAFWLAVMPFAALGGDWAAFFIRLEPAAIWKSAVTLLGVILLWAGIRFPLRLWAPALGGKAAGKRRQILSLTAVPVLTALAVQILSVLWSPLSGARHTWVVTVFTFIPILLWLGILSRSRLWLDAEPSEESLPPGGGTAWLVAGLVALIFFVAVLGPGIGSFEGHPAYTG